MKKFTLTAIIVAGLAAAFLGTKHRELPPTYADVQYGKSDAAILDFWQPESADPAPLFVWIHGGGFHSGDKDTINPILLKALLNNGISVASINYRLTNEATYPAQMLDGARAIQFLRSRAPAWNIDKTRIAAGGGSAGAGIAQWIAFHNDLADPDNPDPVARESTRLTCVLPINMQSTYDPRVTREIIPGIIRVAPARLALFDLPDNWDLDTADISPELDAAFKDASPITHLTADDPPAFIYHFEANREPGNIHHPNFGEHLRHAMDALNIECIKKTSADYAATDGYLTDIVRFLRRHFGMSATTQ